MAKARADEVEKTKRAEILRDVETERLRKRERAQVIDKTFRLLRALIYCGTGIAIAYFVYLSVDSLAGKSTKVDGLISAMLDVGMNRWAAYGLTGIFGTGYVIERRRRHKGIKERAAYIKELEKRLAPERTSSGLQLDGRPKPKDLENA